MRDETRRLRLLVRGMIEEGLWGTVSEAPLVFIGDYEGKPPQPRGVRPKPEDKRYFKPGIGHKVLRDPKNRELAIEKFGKTKDKWAIVTMTHSEVEQPGHERTITDPEFVDSEEFREALRGWRISEDTNVIVVVGIPYEGDYEDVRWTIIHDIIGHTIDREVNYKWSYDVKQSSHFIWAAEGEVWDSLPDDSQIARTERRDDIRADIAAALALGEFEEEELRVATEQGFERAWAAREVVDAPEDEETGDPGGPREVPKYAMFAKHFRGDKDEAKQWFVPQFVRTWMGAVRIWKGKFNREGGRVRGILPFN